MISSARPLSRFSAIICSINISASDDYQDDIDTLVTDNANYYLSYYAMDFNEMKEAYREQMISKYDTADDLDGNGHSRFRYRESRDVMATCACKADLAVDYRALRTNS